MRHPLWIGTACFVAAVALNAQDRPSSIGDRPTSTGERPASTDDGRWTMDDGRSVVQKYCVSCHNEKVKSGGLTLSTLDLARAAEHADVWEQVIRKVRTGAMPPARRPRPDKATTGSFVGYLETEL